MPIKTYFLQVLFPSVSNRAEASTLLIQDTGCAAIFHTLQHEPREVQTQRQLPCFQVPELQDLLHPDVVDKYPYDQTYLEAANDPILVSEPLGVDVISACIHTKIQIMHTSGSTGFPKPLTWTNAHVAVMALGPNWPPFHGRPVSEYYNPPCRGSRRFTAIVVYHASMVAGIAAAVFIGVTAIFPPLHIPTAEYTPVQLEKWLSIGRCETALMFASQLNLIQYSPSLLSEISWLRKVFYIGGGLFQSSKVIDLSLPSGLTVATAPLPPDIADVLRCHVHLATLWGSTEAGYMISHETDPCDYEYICVDARREGIQWKEITPSLYEMCYSRVGPKEGRSKDLLHPQYIFLTYPELENYSTGDLFSPHPSKLGHWKYESRADNTVLLSIGQNVNPRPLEDRIEKHRSIKSAIVVGNGRPRVCLLLELEDDAVESSFDEKIWPHIQRASQGMRSYEKVQRSMIAFVRPDKPLPRTFKGAVRRGRACEIYQKEIEQCYTTV